MMIFYTNLVFGNYDKNETSEIFLHHLETKNLKHKVKAHESDVQRALCLLADIGVKQPRLKAVP